MAQTKELYTIRQVIDLTGASEFLLRIWENRYGAFKPRRTETGRRLYSKEDLLKARLLLHLTKLGLKIGSTAHLPVARLAELLEKQNELPERSPNSIEGQISELFKDAIRFNWDKVQKILRKKTNDSHEFIRNLVVPAALEMNRFVDQKLLSISQEHILTAMLKDAIVRIPAKSSKKKHAMKMVFATPEGDYHDLGLVIAAKLSDLAGHKTLFLGANSPKQDLAETALRFGATHLVLASSINKATGACEDFLKYVHFLDKTLSRKTGLWLAGKNAVGHSIYLERPHRIFSSLEEFEAALND